MRHRAFLAIFCALCFFAPLCASYAEPVKFEIHEFGKNQGFIIFEGDVNSLTSSVSEDQLKLRISGVDTVFQSKRPLNSSSFIKETKLIKRGLNTDLILVFTAPCRVNTQASDSALTFLLTKSEDRNKNSNKSDVERCQNENQKLQTRIRELEAQTASFKIQLEKLESQLPSQRKKR